MTPPDRAEIVSVLREAAAVFRVLARDRDVAEAERAYLEQRAEAAERVMAKLKAEVKAK